MLLGRRATLGTKLAPYVRYANKGKIFFVSKNFWIVLSCLKLASLHSFTATKRKGAFSRTLNWSFLKYEGAFFEGTTSDGSPQGKNYRRVPLLDHEIHGSLAPRSPARMPNIARTIQTALVVKHFTIGL